MENEPQHRIGSPFAPEPDVPPGDNRVRSAAALDLETLGGGAWDQTAISATYAAILLLAFALACWAIFPAGGVAVAGLGATASLIGLSSNRTRLAALTLTLHGVLFFTCYLLAI